MKMFRPLRRLILETVKFLVMALWLLLKSLANLLIEMVSAPVETASIRVFSTWGLISRAKAL